MEKIDLGMKQITELLPKLIEELKKLSQNQQIVEAASKLQALTVERNALSAKLKAISS